MTTSSDNNRLDRMERILDSLVTTVAQNSQQIEANTKLIEANARKTEAIDKQIEANARKTEAIDKQIEVNTRENAELRSTVNALVQIVEQYQINFEIIVGEIRDIKAEIKGLQTESLRIQERLFGQQGNQEQEE